jgi:hypothetical protein
VAPFGDVETRAALAEEGLAGASAIAAGRTAIWDGAQSLGGVWIARPGVDAPERIRIRDAASGRVVDGLLFDIPDAVAGADFAMSSRAAEALDLPPRRAVRIDVLEWTPPPPEDPTASAPPA